ncbi:MarR family winged helix-turn-helix transcriptional regulator [Arthrobacter sp. STN4]|uniref:MarR family winged helix-turn-helix transcriptional regulator n=1 Tax=Arthrobacter sp. STN4 TaxID=2923276 RepID=UPI002119C5B3|nr:MarR family winged helix-turn-helix transcriptional regulator [Arthrobacter sp. STN4]MCQ9163499.1 MarR family winged helix-turn-helix transcriptional regulator [Arthrobacter sp. STN4]
MTGQGGAAGGTRWLSTEEQHLWLELREFLSGMPRVIDRQLSRDSDVSGGEYAVLAAISEAPAEGVRSGDLAAILSWEKSRVSHLLRRMESKGLVVRCAASADGRGQEISLTETGWAAVRAAASGHVGLVRETVFDPLAPAELAQLRASLQKIRAAAVDKGLW